MSKLPIIGLIGMAGAGKDTLGRAMSMLPKTYRPGTKIPIMPTTIAFADGMRAIAHDLFGLTDGQMTDRHQKEEPLPELGDRSPRAILIHIGQSMRQLDPDVWVKLTMRRARRLAPHGYLPIITDVRMPNEVAAIQEAGGLLVFVAHPNPKYTGRVSERLAECIQAGAHPPGMPDIHITHRFAPNDDVAARQDVAQHWLSGLVQGLE